MALSPKVLAILEEMLDTGRSAEDVCQDHPELLPEVRRRWKTFRLVDNAVAAFLPDTRPGQNTLSLGPCSELPQIAGYNIEAELGHGGMGIVYQASHLALNRIVALKMLLAGTYASTTERERFQREAQAVAALRHPNIVQVYDVGEVGGRPYFTMELVEGGSLAEQIKGIPQPAQQAAHLIATLAEAVGVAHESGIVHRDLKPSNILLTPTGTPKVTDFGLARRLGSNGDLTLSGIPLGTPSYMSPCQARGDKTALSPATDVYALGAILYELLTGRPPFHAETPTATLHQVLTHDPVTPGRLNARVPRDLETICLKCLEKEPHRRYPTGTALAEELRRYLRREPILARPIGMIGRMSRWARRHPGTAISSAALILTVLIAVSVIVWKWRDAVTARRATDRMATRLVLDRGIILCERGHIGIGLQWFARGIVQAERSGNYGLLPSLRTNLTAWSTRHVVPRTSQSFGSSVTAVAFHPDGKRLLVARWKDAFGKPGPGQAVVVDADTWEPRCPAMDHPGGIRAADFSPDGTRILTAGGDGTVRLWDSGSGQAIGNPLKVGTFLSAVAFAPDGRTFATADITSATTGEAKIWNAATFEPLTPVMAHHGMLQCLAFSPDGRLLLTGCGPVRASDQPVGGEARFWNCQTGHPVGPALVHTAPVSAVGFSPDGETFLTGSVDGVLLRWRLANRERMSPPLHHFSPLRAALFSPDGRTLITANGVSNRPKEKENAVRLWDADSGSLLVSPWSYEDSLWSISGSRDGLRFATGCADGHVRVYSLPAVQPKRSRFLHGMQLTDHYTTDGAKLIAAGDVMLKFSPDGRTLLAGGNTPGGREAARVVDVITGQIRELLPERKTLLVEAAAIVGMAANVDGECGFMALSTLATIGTQESLVECVAFGTAGKTAVTTDDSGKVRIWDAESGMLIQGPRSYGKELTAGMNLILDESKLVIGGRGKLVEVWDWSKGQIVASPITAPAIVQAMALSPEGQILATAGNGGIVQLWDVSSGKSIRSFDAVNETIWSLRFSPDGKMLLAGGKGTAWILDAKTGKQRTQPLPHPATVWEAQFSRDGKRVLTVCSDEYRDLHPGTVHVWDVRTGKLTGPALPQRVAGLAAAFDFDGNLVATGGFDGDVRFWDAATCAPVGPALIQAGPIPAIAFVSGTKLLAAAGRDGSLVLWPVPTPRAGSAKEISEWIQSLTGPPLTESDALADPR